MVSIEKHLFAAYLNMARQNAFITLSHISKIIGGGTGSEENLSLMKPVRILTDNKALPEDVERTKKLLNRHFPFLKPMLNKEMQFQNADKPEPEMYHKILTKVFGTLNRQRNQYTHARHEKEPFDKELISYMKNCFDGAVRVVKERFNLQDKDVMH